MNNAANPPAVNISDSHKQHVVCGTQAFQDLLLFILLSFYTFCEVFGIISDVKIEHVVLEKQIQ